MNYGFIYLTTCLIDDCIYVGQRVIQNKKSDETYLGSGKYLKRAIKKHGIENFIREILEYCKDQDQLNEREMYWIDKFNARDQETGYNIAPGGRFGDVLTNHPDKEEIYKRRGIGLSRYLHTEEGRIKRRETMLKIHQRLEHKEKMRSIQKEVQNREDVRLKKSINGKITKNKPEAKQLASIQSKKKWQNEEYREKIRQSQIKSWLNGERGILQSNKGKERWRQQVVVTCNICNKTGRGFTFKAHHFSNCKIDKMELDGIESIEYLDDNNEIYVYNIAVDQPKRENRNYFVNGVLTHNCDDLQNPKKANSEVERKNTIERYDQTISNRLNQLEVGGRIIIMQRLHEDDLTGYLMNPRTGRPDSHRHICIPAELDLEMISPKELQVHYQDGLFWPSRFSKKVIADEKKKGLLYFAGQFGQRPVPPEGNIFKRKWFEIIPPHLIQREVQNSPIHFIIDSAYTEDQTERNDPSGILCVFKKDNYIYIINFTQVWMEFPDLIKFIKQYVMMNGWTYNSLILIEPKASGKSIAQQLRAGLEEGEHNLNVVEIEGEWIRDDKVTRANSVSPIAMAGRFKLVEGPWNDLFLGQLTSFPKASHDEAVDCTVYASNYLIPLNEFLSAWI